MLIVFHESIVAATVWIVPLVIALIGIGGSPYQKVNKGNNGRDICHLNYPISFHLQPPHRDINSDKEEDHQGNLDTSMTNNTSVSIGFEVCSQKTSGFFTIEGYGFLNIPILSTNEGSSIHKIKTWKNKGTRGQGGIFSNIRQNMYEYYLGGSSKLPSTFATAASFEFNEVFQAYRQNTSKLGYITESHGNISLRVSITRERSLTSSKDKNQKASINSNVSDFTNDIDSVLSRVRKNRTERKIREITRKRESEDDVLTSLLSITTANKYVPAAISTTTISSNATISNKNSIDLDSYKSNDNKIINIGSRGNSTITNTSNKNARTAEILSKIKTRKEARKKDSLFYVK